MEGGRSAVERPVTAVVQVQGNDVWPGLKKECRNIDNSCLRSSSPEADSERRSPVIAIHEGSASKRK